MFGNDIWKQIVKKKKHGGGTSYQASVIQDINYFLSC